MGVKQTVEREGEFHLSAFGVDWPPRGEKANQKKKPAWTEQD